MIFQKLINPWPSNITVLNLLETISRSNWKFGMFWGEGKTGIPREKMEPTTNSNRMWHQQQDLNLDFIGGRQVPSTLDNPCPPNMQ